MFGNVNEVTLMGRMGANPEIRSTQNGTKVATLSIATTVFYKTKEGEKKERTEWHRVVVFNDRFIPVIEAVSQKGAHIYLKGALQTRSWDDKTGVKRYTTEIVIQKFQGDFQVVQGGIKPSQGQAGDPGPDDESDIGYQRSKAPPASFSHHLDDEIPF